MQKVMNATRLVLNRTEGQSIQIDGPAKITVEPQGNRTKLIIEAPPTTKIVRSELISRG